MEPSLYQKRLRPASARLSAAPLLTLVDALASAHAEPSPSENKTGPHSSFMHLPASIQNGLRSAVLFLKSNPVTAYLLTVLSRSAFWKLAAVLALFWFVVIPIVLLIVNIVLTLLMWAAILIGLGFVMKLFASGKSR